MARLLQVAQWKPCKGRLSSVVKLSQTFFRASFRPNLYHRPPSNPARLRPSTSPTPYQASFPALPNFRCHSWPDSGAFLRHTIPRSGLSPRTLCIPWILVLGGHSLLASSVTQRLTYVSDQGGLLGVKYDFGDLFVSRFVHVSQRIHCQHTSTSHHQNSMQFPQFTSFV